MNQHGYLIAGTQKMQGRTYYVHHVEDNTPVITYNKANAMRYRTKYYADQVVSKINEFSIRKYKVVW